MRKHMIAVIILLINDLIQRSPEKDRAKLSVIRVMLAKIDETIPHNLT